MHVKNKLIWVGLGSSGKVALDYTLYLFRHAVVFVALRKNGRLQNACKDAYKDAYIQDRSLSESLSLGFAHS